MSPGPEVKRPREQNLPKMSTRALGSRGCMLRGRGGAGLKDSECPANI